MTKVPKPSYLYNLPKKPLRQIYNPLPCHNIAAKPPLLSHGALHASGTESGLARSAHKNPFPFFVHRSTTAKTMMAGRRVLVVSRGQTKWLGTVCEGMCVRTSGRHHIVKRVCGDKNSGHINLNLKLCADGNFPLFLFCILARRLESDLRGRNKLNSCGYSSQ